MQMQKEKSSDRAANSRLNPEPRTPNPLFRRGFTFTEVMFAVILLGIGFIMLAGMFPVAYTIGTDFKPSDRTASEANIRWNHW